MRAPTAGAPAADLPAPRPSSARSSVSSPSPTGPTRRPASRPARRPTRRPARLAGRPRRVLRAVHVLVSVGWLGLAAAMLTLGLGLVLTPDVELARAGYALMGYVGTGTIAGTAVASTLTGVALSVLTPWGLVRHWWMVVKVVCTAAVIVSSVGVTNGWVAAAAAQAADRSGSAGWPVVAGSVVHLLLLGLATVISVDKPWGATPRGRTAARAATPPEVSPPEVSRPEVSPPEVSRPAVRR